MKKYFLLLVIVWFVAPKLVFGQFQWDRVDRQYSHNYIVDYATSLKGGTLLARSSGDGFYISNDQGQSWESLIKDIKPGYQILEMHQTDNGNIYILFSTGYDNYVVILDCSDNYTVTGYSDDYISPGYGLKDFYLDKNDTMMISLNNNIYRFIGYGIFTNISSDKYINCYVLTSQGTIIAGSNYQIITSQDFGQTWSIVNANTSYCQGMKILKNDDIVGYTSDGIFFKSKDLGSSIIVDTIKINNNKVNIRNIFTDENDKIYIQLNDSVYMESSNEGATWNNISFSGINLPIRIFNVGIEGKIIIADAALNYYFTSDNGSNWNKLNFNWYAPKIRNMVILNKTELITSGDDNGIFKSTNNGVEWENITSGDTPNNLCAALNGDIFSIGSKNNITCYANTGTQYSCINGMNNNPITLFSANDSVVLAGTMGGGIYYSTDFGLYWNQVNPGGAISSIYSFAQNKIGELYGFSKEDGVYKSTNGGYLWTKIGNGPDTIPLTIASCAPNGYIYAYSPGNGVYRSTNTGIDWELLKNDISNYPVTSIVIDSNNRVYASTLGKGILMSNNNGDSWSNFSSNIPSDTIYSMVCDSSGYLYASAGDNKLYKSQFNVLSVGDNPNLNVHSTLEIFPNPVSNQINIKYTLSQPGIIKIKILNQLGQECDDYELGYRNYGNYNDNLSIAKFNLTDGVYYLKMEINGDVLIKKFVIIE